MAGNARSTTQSTLLSIMRRKPFVRGFADVRAGHPFDPDAFVEGNDQWLYERGRQFAVVFGGTLKVGRSITQEAHVAMIHAKRAGSII